MINKVMNIFNIFNNHKAQPETSLVPTHGYEDWSIKM